VPDTELDNFAQGVINALTGNAAFPAPPITLVSLQAARDDLTAKMAAAQTGGPADTAAKNNSRQALTTMLRDVAAYVQIRCNNDPAILLSSGFEMQSTNRAQVELPQPQSLSLKNGATGQLIGRVDPIKKAASSRATVTGCRASSRATRSTSSSTGSRAVRTTRRKCARWAARQANPIGGIPVRTWRCSFSLRSRR
jgi:hypothetical protein